MAVITVTDWASFITAIGTAGADVEFPHSSTYIKKTHDTEVNPDKLYLDSNGIVQTNVQANQLSHLYENTFTLDANSQDGFPNGVTSTIEINCASINGYGGTIVNLASTTVDIFANSAAVTVNQLAILNINVENVSFIDTTAASVIYTKCIFSGRAKGDAGTTHTVFGDVANTHSSRYNSCSFNFDIIGSYCLYNYLNYGGYVYAGPLYDCRINVTHIDRDEITASGTLWVRLENSYLTGEMTDAVTITITAQSHYSVIEVEKGGSISVNDSQGGTVQLILINNTLYTGTIPTGCIGVDNTTLSTASALAALGFPIQT